MFRAGPNLEQLVVSERAVRIDGDGVVEKATFLNCPVVRIESAFVLDCTFEGCARVEIGSPGPETTASVASTLFYDCGRIALLADSRECTFKQCRLVEIAATRRHQSAKDATFEQCMQVVCRCSYLSGVAEMCNVLDIQALSVYTLAVRGNDRRAIEIAGEPVRPQVSIDAAIKARVTFHSTTCPISITSPDLALGAYEQCTGTMHVISKRPLTPDLPMQTEPSPLWTRHRARKIRPRPPETNLPLQPHELRKRVRFEGPWNDPIEEFSDTDSDTTH